MSQSVETEQQIVGVFSYKAVDQGGSHVAGTVEAADRRSAVATLSGQGHYVTELLERAHPKETALGKPKELPISLSLGSKRISGKDILTVTTQLSTAVRAGLPYRCQLQTRIRWYRVSGLRQVYRLPLLFLGLPLRCT